MWYLAIPVPFLIWALMTDWKNRKIYNKTTYPLIVLGVCVQLYINGIATAGVLLGIIVMFILLRSIYKGAIAAGGDVKLMLGCCLYLELKEAVFFILIMFLLSAVLGIVLYARQQGAKKLYQTLKLDLITAGTAPKEKVHILGALVILVSYGIVAVVCLL